MDPYHSVACYFFTGKPPNEPRLYFPERTLITMVTCSGEPPQYTVLPHKQGTVDGRWTLHMPPVPKLNLVVGGAFKPWTLLRQDLVGATMRWEDWETGKVSVWVLTDSFTTWHPDRQGNIAELRLGRWMD